MGIIEGNTHTLTYTLLELVIVILLTHLTDCINRLLREAELMQGGTNIGIGLYTDVRDKSCVKSYIYLPRVRSR